MLADFIRRELIKSKASFSFETVMSSVDKVELLSFAQKAGYRTYLYYIATEDPAINVARVQERVRQGGHSVPEDKIRTRYARSLDYLLAAIKYTNRAFIFDNSAELQERVWVAEITDGKTLIIKTPSIPAWFKTAVVDKISSANE